MEINWNEVMLNSRQKKRKEKEEILSQMKALKIGRDSVSVRELSRQTGISRITLTKWLKEVE